MPYMCIRAKLFPEAVRYAREDPVLVVRGPLALLVKHLFPKQLYRFTALFNLVNLRIDFIMRWKPYISRFTTRNDFIIYIP